MSRRTADRPPLDTPRVILAHDPASRRRRLTLIGLASRALYVAGRATEAALLRDRLLAADPADHRAILRASVDFWPTGQDMAYPVGDPACDWSGDHIPPEQRRRSGA